MISLAVLYIAQDALFLGVVQVVVYTGAVMMLFLFVLMLIGVDSAGLAGGNHSRTTRRGHRRRRRLRHPADRRHRQRCRSTGFTGLRAGQRGGNVEGLAALIFTRYLWAFELTSALLITAALGAMVLAHRERFERRKTQRELAERALPARRASDADAQSRCVRPAQRGRHAGRGCPTARTPSCRVTGDPAHDANAARGRVRRTSEDEAGRQ